MAEIQGLEKYARMEVELLMRSTFRKRKPVGLKCTKKEGKTEQAHEPACNINTIMKRYVPGSIVPGANPGQARYMDCTAADFEGAQILVAEQRSIFAQLPAEVRTYFGHDPARYLAALNDPEREEELAGLGLFPEKALIIEEEEEHDETDQKPQDEIHQGSGEDGDGENPVT